MSEGSRLRVLIAEDSEDDALLIVRELERGGYDPVMCRVDSEPEMRAALEEGGWDLIITDHNMPSFDSGDALRLAREYDPNVPFILVSGSIGEEIAVDAMKAGAHDYVMKDNLTRLLPAIERELREAENRRAHQEAQARIRHLAYHDSLTGLINRSEFERRLDEAVRHAAEEGRCHTLFYLDLDQFKLVNDSCGHLAGDEMLRRLAKRLRQAIRESDTLARLGGDEFGILLMNCAAAQAEPIAQNLLDSLRDYFFVWGDRSFKVGASIGMVEIDGTRDSYSLLSMADMACYAAKDRGRNRYHRYAEGDRELKQRRGEMQWVQRLQKALERDGLVLYWQPIRSLYDAGMHHEVLLRMKEGSELITPDRFIPAAERYNLMPEVDRWVIHHALRRLRVLTPKGGDRILFINLSATSLSDEGLVDFIRNEVVAADLKPEQVGFEITETAAIADFDCARDLIQRLRDFGCRVALDDFGTGMSSFSYLKSLTVDFIKIDGSFVRRMREEAVDSAIVEAVNRIAHISGIRTIAEFVEDAEAMERLRAMGVDFAQGWAVARPEPMPEAAPLQAAGSSSQ